MAERYTVVRHSEDAYAAFHLAGGVRVHLESETGDELWMSGTEESHPIGAAYELDGGVLVPVVDLVITKSAQKNLRKLKVTVPVESAQSDESQSAQEPEA
jgi:hypothetical protein